MYKIEVKPSCIIINDYKLGDCPKLENSFRLWNKATFTHYYKQIEYNEEAKQLIIPKGVDLSFIENLFNVRAYFDYGCDRYEKNLSPTLIKYKPRDNKQVEALKFLTSQDNYSYTASSNQLMLSLNTGAGKTYLGIAYTAILNIKTVIITDSNNWLEQWKDRIIEHSNITEREIYYIKGSASINSLMNKSSEELSRYKIYLLTHSTTASYANNNGWDSIRHVFVHLGIGLKIFDEAHLNFDNISRIDFHTSTFKTLYLTATPAKGDEQENNIFKLYFKNIPKLILFDPESDPHTNYIAIRYKSGLDASEISNCVNMYGFNRTVYCDQVILKENFDYLLRIVMDIIMRMYGKKLIFLATNKAVDFVYNWILSNYPEFDENMIGIFTSLNPNKEDALKCPIILTTSKSAGAAVDIAGLSCAVQLAEPIKSEPQNRQRFGRTRGYNTLYIDIVDESCAITRKYYIQNLPMFEKYALSVKEIRFKDKELKEQAFNIMENRLKNGICPFIKL